MTIQVSDQTFPATKCKVCGARDSNPETLAKHENWHDKMSKLCRGELGRRKSPTGNLEVVELKKCPDCGQPGWCATHYRRKRRASGRRDDRKPRNGVMARGQA